MAALPRGAETLHRRLPSEQHPDWELCPVCRGPGSPTAQPCACSPSPSPLQPTIFLFTLKPLEGINRFLLSHMSHRWPHRTPSATPDVGRHLTNEGPAFCSVSSPRKVTQPADTLLRWLTQAGRLWCQPSLQSLLWTACMVHQWLAESTTCAPQLRSFVGVHCECRSRG